MRFMQLWRWCIGLMMIAGVVISPPRTVTHAQDPDPCATDLPRASELLATAKAALDIGDVVSALNLTREAQAILERCADSPTAQALAAFDINRLVYTPDPTVALLVEMPLVWVDNQQILNISGLIRNTQPLFIGNLALKLTFYDFANAVVGESTFVVSAPWVGPNESVPFQITFDGFLGTAARYTITVSGDAIMPSATIFYGTENFTVAQNEAVYNDAGQLTLSGTVTNTGTLTGREVRMIFSFVDSQERIIAVQLTDLGEMPINTALPYELVLANSAGEAARYDLQVVGQADITCATLPRNGFGNLYAANSLAALGLGCAVSADAIETITAYQPFERGFMVYMASLNGVPSILAVYNDGTYQYFQDTWQEGVDPTTGGMSPPRGGLIEPIRGFGKVWREQAGVQDLLGWATGDEVGSSNSYLQVFEKGIMLYLPQTNQTLIALVETGSWFVFPMAYNLPQ